METRSDPTLQFLNPHISKSKTCFKKFEYKAFRWHLEAQQNQIESIFKLKFKKWIKSEKWFCTLPPPHLFHLHPLIMPPGIPPGIPPPPIIPAAIFYILAICSGDIFFIIWLACLIMAGSMLAIIGLNAAACWAYYLSCSSDMLLIISAVADAWFGLKFIWECLDIDYKIIQLK